MIDRALEAIRNSLDEGNFREEDLWTLLNAIESKRLIVAGKSNLPRLTPEQLTRCRALAAALIHKHCGGRIVKAGAAWTSKDGVDLKVGMR